MLRSSRPICRLIVETPTSTARSGRTIRCLPGSRSGWCAAESQGCASDQTGMSAAVPIAASRCLMAALAFSTNWTMSS